MQRFPDLGDRQVVSTGGGRNPLWSPDGTELFYLSPDGRRVMRVPVSTEPTFTAGLAEVLFEGQYLPSIGPRRPFQITPDGERFIMIKPLAEGGGEPTGEIILVQNWFEELKARVPVN